MRIAVIGAGVGGLCSTHYLKQEFPSAEVVVFEMMDCVGGTWNYTDETYDKQFNVPTMTAMYKNLRTNLPAAVMVFPDFPFDGPLDTFISSDVFLTYLKEYAAHFDIIKHIKFRHMVTSVMLTEGGWCIYFRDLRGMKHSAQTFDYVYVCNGHNNFPAIPNIKGQDIFKGGQIHSFNYRRPEIYKDKRVLVIGSGPSGLDIAINVAEECKELFLSHHKQTLSSPFPSNFHQKPDVQEFTSNKVVFNDGSSEEIDEVLYCTGYSYHLPFLDSSCGVTVDNSGVKYVYRNIVNIEHPTMFFIGLPQMCCPVPLMDIQVRYTIALLKGLFVLPPKDKMMEHWKKIREEIMKSPVKRYQLHFIGEYEVAYYNGLHKESGVTNVPKVIPEIRQSLYTNLNNLYTLRNYHYQVIDENTFVKTYQEEPCELPSS